MQTQDRHVFLAFAVILLFAALVMLMAGSASAQAIDAGSPAVWQAGGFVDAAYLKDFNDPANHLFRARGTTPRVNELDVDMAAAYVRKTASASSRWGLEATVQGGEDSIGFGFSPTAPNVSGADWLRHLGPTDVSYLLPIGRGLTVQGGIFSSLVGYDSLYAKDNFTYTRPWCADFTPYLMAGANVSYPFSNRVTLTGFIINSYFHLSHPNDAPNVGGQVDYAATPRFSIKETVLYGSHQADVTLPHWRVLSDTIAERKTGRLTVAGELQLARETLAGSGDGATWAAVQFPVHLSVRGPWSVSVRPELAHDPSGRYTGVRQTVIALTSGIEYRAAGHGAQAIARLEYRYDRSTGLEGGFFSGPSNDLVPGQPLLAAGLILTFERTRRATQ